MLATIASHYTTSYIFFFMLLFILLIGLVLRKNMASRSITGIMVGLFLIFVFIWYSQLTEAPFVSGVSFISRTIRSLAEFFVAEARSPDALTVFGGGAMPGNPFLSWVHFVITWASFAFIAVGVIGTLLKRKTMLLLPRQGNSVSPPLNVRFETEYFLLAIACSGLLVAMLVLPLVSVGYGVQRGYSQAVVVLSTFFILGSVVLTQRWRKSAYLLILIVLIPYALFNTGALYELFGIHDKNWLLSVESPAYRYEFVYDQETFSAKWLKEHMDDSLVRGLEARAVDKLKSQGIMSSRLFAKKPQEDNYIYLTYNNVVYSEFVARGKYHSMSQYREMLASENKLYSNGGSEIYK